MNGGVPGVQQAQDRPDLPAASADEYDIRIGDAVEDLRSLSGNGGHVSEVESDAVLLRQVDGLLLLVEGVYASFISGESHLHRHGARAAADIVAYVRGTDMELAEADGAHLAFRHRNGGTHELLVGDAAAHAALRSGVVYEKDRQGGEGPAGKVAYLCRPDLFIVVGERFADRHLQISEAGADEGTGQFLHVPAGEGEDFAVPPDRGYEIGVKAVTAHESGVLPGPAAFRKEIDGGRDAGIYGDGSGIQDRQEPCGPAVEPDVAGEENGDPLRFRRTDDAEDILCQECHGGVLFQILEFRQHAGRSDQEIGLFHGFERLRCQSAAAHADSYDGYRFHSDASFSLFMICSILQPSESSGRSMTATCMPQDSAARTFS